ncbi:MAG: EAL domain-containing protein [Cetobacterium sp.]|uniref:sensor domain-containing protein n=1 Tax=Cetobacterium sp. TaxID=2071632 RepID=UPI002FC92834
MKLKKRSKKNLLIQKLREEIKILKQDNFEQDIQLKTLMNNIPYMTWFKDKNSNYIMVNDAFKSHSGKNMETIYGKSDDFVWDGMLGEKCREYDLDVMEKNTQVVFDEVIPGKQGYREFNIYKAPVHDYEGTIIGTVGIAKDITDLKNENTKVNIIMENIPSAVWLNDVDGNILNVNSKFYEFFKIPNQSVIGENVLKIVGEKFKNEIETENRLVLTKRKTMSFERKIVIDKEEKIVSVHKTPVLDLENKIIGIVGMMQDITKSKKTQEKIEKLVYTDTLTDLGNRRALYKYFNEIKDKDCILTVMTIDLDNFKKLNDSLGHHMGDKAIIIIGEKLKESCADGFIGRNGGDEFIIIWDNLNSIEEVKKISEKILSNIVTEFRKEDKFNVVSASIGVVSEKLDGNNLVTLLMKADFALYEAKDLGKNCYVIYTQELEEKRILSIDIEQDLKKSIERDEIHLHYQPQYTNDGKIFGFEALFRWKNEKYSKVPVLEIIKIMENQNILYIVSDSIIEKALTFIKRINKKYNTEYLISINISTLEIMDRDFVPKIKNLLNKIDINPKWVGLEITETTLMKDMDKNIEKLKELKDMGIRISLDDFGTGYSSFNYLIRLPLSEVKIDRSFVSKIFMGNEYEKLVKLIIDLSHSLNLPVVAEGVETVEEFNILKNMNTDYYQGYYFSKPIEEEKIIELIDNIEKAGQ